MGWNSSANIIASINFNNWKISSGSSFYPFSHGTKMIIAGQRGHQYSNEQSAYTSHIRITLKRSRRLPVNLHDPKPLQRHPAPLWPPGTHLTRFHCILWSCVPPMYKIFYANMLPACSHMHSLHTPQEHVTNTLHAFPAFHLPPHHSQVVSTLFPYLRDQKISL